MATRAERQFISRQFHLNHVPHPLIEGLVAFWPAGTPQERIEAMLAIAQKATENELAKVRDGN